MNNNNKEHICLLDLSHKKNKNDNNKRKLNEENYEYKLPEIIEKIIINIYEIKMSVIYIPDKKKFIKKETKNENKSNSQCNIF